MNESGALSFEAIVADGIERLAGIDLAARAAALNVDGPVKSPISALGFILRHCDVPLSTSHFSGFASLDLGAFYDTVLQSAFYGFINVD